MYKCGAGEQPLGLLVSLRLLHGRIVVSKCLGIDQPSTLISSGKPCVSDAVTILGCVVWNTRTNCRLSMGQMVVGFEILGFGWSAVPCRVWLTTPI